MWAGNEPMTPDAQAAATNYVLQSVEQGQPLTIEGLVVAAELDGGSIVREHPGPGADHAIHLFGIDLPEVRLCGHDP